MKPKKVGLCRVSNLPLCGAHRACAIMTSTGGVTNLWFSPHRTWMAFPDFPNVTGPAGSSYDIVNVCTVFTPSSFSMQVCVRGKFFLSQCASCDVITRYGHYVKWLEGPTLFLGARCCVLCQLKPTCTPCLIRHFLTPEESIIEMQRAIWHDSDRPIRYSSLSAGISQQCFIALLKPKH